MDTDKNGFLSFAAGTDLRTPKAVQDISPESSAKRDHPGYSASAPEMLVEFRGVRRIRKGGKKLYAIRLGRILKIKGWQKTMCD